MHSTPFAWSLRRTFSTPDILLGTCTYGRIRELRLMVEWAGFEPAVLWSQTRCDTKLRYHSIKNTSIKPTGIGNSEVFKFFIVKRKEVTL